MSIYELFGWLGAILVLIAYYLVSTEKRNSNSLSFQSLNIVGAVLLVLYTYNCKAYASMSVNLIWILIGMASITKVQGSQTRKGIISFKLSREKRSESDFF